jgi:polysaccharide deacetylase 2 family uncharacterized protein YibQ
MRAESRHQIEKRRAESSGREQIMKVPLSPGQYMAVLEQTLTIQKIQKNVRAKPRKKGIETTAIQ